VILVGRYLSPFVRRVGISLTLAGLPFDRRIISALAEQDKLLKINPVGRVPALILGKGKAAETLVDSTAILDYVDEKAGRKALTPAKGAARRRVQALVFLGLGTLEKAVAALYERGRPADKIHQPWLDRVEGQARSGLEALNAIVPKPYLAGARLTQADVTAAVMISFLKHRLPHLVPDGRYKRLETLARKLERLPAFKACQPEQL